jgi:hypothetical protein
MMPLTTRLIDFIENANKKAVELLNSSEPVLVDCKPAIEVIPGMTRDHILHAGPPIDWEKMCGPMKGAVIGALMYENRVKDQEQAEELARSGHIIFEPCHHHSSVGPMAGVISPSMYVFVVKNHWHGNLAFATINEGLGKVLRFGAFDQEVISRLRWMQEILGPSLGNTLKLSSGIEIGSIISRALQMGDECHNRNVAASLLLLNELTPLFFESGMEKKNISEIIDFISSNPHFFLNVSMASCKAAADTIRNLKGSSVVYAMARNGVEFGVMIAGTGEKWFTAPAGLPKGLYFPGYSEIDANPDLGDSTITETSGLGGFAMAAAPSIVKFIGGAPSDAIKKTREMYEITCTSHGAYKIPILDFQGTPLGIDVRKVVELGITPVINTGIAHKKPGIGQIGAGILNAPYDPFKMSLINLIDQIKLQGGDLC